MANITFGNNGTYASFSAAIAAASPGDHLIGLGPYTETGQALTIATANLTVLFVNGAYVFDGGHATATFLSIAANGVTVDGADYMRITQYNGVNVVDISGDDCIFQNAEIDDYGAAGAIAYGILATGDNVQILNNRVHDSIDATTGQANGIRVQSCADPIVKGNRVYNLTSIGAGGDTFGITLGSNCLNPSAEDNEVTALTATSNAIGFFLLGSATAGSAGLLLRNKINTLISVTSGAQGISIWNGTWKIGCHEIYGMVGVGNGRGINWGGTLVDPTDPLCWIINNTFDDCEDQAVYLSMTHDVTVRNTIVNGTPLNATGFWCNAPAAPFIDSDYNNAHGMVTPYDPLWPLGANDTEVAPEFADVAAHDYMPQHDTETTFQSLMIDSGEVVAYITTDIDGNPRQSGYGQDRGCYEYQWPTPRYLEAVGKLPGQYGDSTYFKLLVRALVGAISNLVSIEELWDVFQTLKRNLWIRKALGIQLDNLGAILGLHRGGLTDDEYRLRLYVQAVINSSQGIASQVFHAIDLWFNPDWQFVIEWYTGFVVYVKTAVPIPLTVTDTLQPLAGAGIPMWFASAGDRTPFGFSEVTAGHVVTESTRGTDGFNEVSLGHVYEGIGGYYTELYPHFWEV